MPTLPARVVALLALLVVCCLAGPGAASASERILGGPRIDASAVPYVASLTLDDDSGTPIEQCSGAIIDQRRILTSAHCFDTPGKPVKGGRVRLGSNTIEPMPASAGSQTIAIASFRVHPRHVPDAALVRPDDIAVATLASPIAFGPRAQAIDLVGVNAYPATGAALVQAGYGKQSPGADPDGYLHGRLATTLSPDDCGASNAVQLCYSQPASAGCPGDSGGPIAIDGVLVGINASGECAAGSPGSAASLAAPEIRAFVDGSDSPPVAPVGTTFASISGVPQVGRTITCAPGGWVGATGYAYAFEDARDGTQLQAGASPTRVLAATDVGRPIRCLVAALSAGGIGQRHSGTLPAVIPAPVPTTTTTGSTATTTVPTTAPVAAGASVSVSVTSKLRRRSRHSLRVRIRTGATALGRNVVCVAVSKRARLVRSRGALKAKTHTCRTYSRQSANTTRTVSLRVRSTSRGAVRVTATVTPEGGAAITASRLVRSR